MGEVIYMTRKAKHRNTPDFLGHKFSAQMLAKNIQKKYHKRGHFNVRVWVEDELLPSGKTIYNIRSNIHFEVPA